MNRRTLLAVAAWLGAALTAILVGVVAIELVGTSIIGTPGDIRSQADIERALASAPLPRSSPVLSLSPSPAFTRVPRRRATARPSALPTAALPLPAVRREFRTEGGFVVAECAAGLARLVSWSPSRGYGVDEVDRGPDDDVSVTFDGPDDVELTITCVEGVPEGTVERDD